MRWQYASFRLDTLKEPPGTALLLTLTLDAPKDLDCAIEPILEFPGFATGFHEMQAVRTGQRACRRTWWTE